MLIDRRDDVGHSNPEPARVSLDFDVTDVSPVAARLESMTAHWLAPLENRDGLLSATAIDPDGNYVQIVAPAEAHQAATRAAQG